jgi:PAS domain S-box-containing protein
MQDQEKTKQYVIKELEDFRRRVSELEEAQARLEETERLLKESERKFRLLYESAPLGYQSLDENGYFLEVNRAWLNILGYSREEVIGKWFGDFLAPGYQEHFKISFSKFKEAGEIHWVEFEMLRKDGQRVFVALDGQMQRDEQGQFKQTHCILHDVTERKKSEEALSRANKEWERTFNAISDGIMVLDNRHRIIRANKSMTDTLGITEEDLIGKPCFEIVHGETAPPAFCPHSQLLADGEEHSAEVVEPRLGATFDVRVSPVLDQTAQVLGSVHVARDITARKQVEVELRRSNELLRAIIAAAPTPIFGLDLDGNVQMVWNPAAERVLGWSAEEVLGRPLPSVPSEKAEEFSRFRERIRSGTTLDGVEVRMVKRDGSPIDYSIYAAPLHDAEGRVSGNIAVLVDITERKRWEQTLSEREYLLKTILSTSPVGIAITKNRKIAWASEVWKRMFGFDNENEYLGQDTRMLYVSGEEYEHAGMVLYRGLETGNVGELDTRFKRKDGSVFDAYVKVKALDPLDLDKGTVSAISDISALKRAQEVQRRLAAAIEQSAEAVVITDAEGRIQYVNPATEQISGFQKSEIVGNNPRIFKSGEHDRAFYEQMWKTIRAGNIWSGRIINRKKDGSLYHEDATISPVRDSSGKIANFVAVKRDVTGHLSLSRQLVQAQKMESIGTLAGGIAHDFNNLLTVILGFTELLLEERQEKDRDYADFQKIFQAAKSGAELVQRLLLFSRKAEPKPVPMDLNKQIVQVETLIRRTIPKTIDIKLDLSDDIPHIKADPAQVEQALMNLVVNARDAMPDGGKLTVATSAVTVDEEYARLHVEASPGRYVLMEVKDTGQGIDKETLDHIFEPFFTTKGRGRGTGLGLSMVYGIVKQHNGFISVSSEVAKGTVFRAYFPAILADEGPEIDDSGVMPGFGTETVLLVDDQESVRDLGSRILTKRGYNVLQASDGKEALNVFKRERSKISLIILDLDMPTMGGAECLKELLALDPNVKVLITSGYSAESSVRASIQLGAKGFVSKPFRVKRLLGTVRGVLDESSEPSR